MSPEGFFQLLSFPAAPDFLNLSGSRTFPYGMILSGRYCAVPNSPDQFFLPSRMTFQDAFGRQAVTVLPSTALPLSFSGATFCCAALLTAFRSSFLRTICSRSSYPSKLPISQLSAISSFRSPSRPCSSLCHALRRPEPAAGRRLCRISTHADKDNKWSGSMRRRLSPS